MRETKLSHICRKMFVTSLLMIFVMIPILILLYNLSFEAPSNNKPLVNDVRVIETEENKTNEKTKSINDGDVTLSIGKYVNINKAILDINNNEEEDNDTKNVLLLSNYEKGESLPKVEYKLDKTGYVSTGLRIRERPNTKSKILGVLGINSKVKYSIYNKDWVVIKRNKKYVYISKKYVKDKPVKIVKNNSLNNSGNINSTYITKSVMGDRRKSYMDYRCITSRSSRQYKLQHNYAYTGSNGVRMVDGRYCIALGSYYTHNIGQYVDLILANGTVIKCIVSDAKANRDTNYNNSVGGDGSVAEFIVDTPRLSSQTKRMGDVSYASTGWNSNVVKIKIYNKNIF